MKPEVTSIKAKNDKKIKVFISSLEEELSCEREFAVRAIEDIYLETDVVAVRSEDFLASPRREEYIHQLRESDFVVLILWKNMSEPVKKEIEEARRLGKHLLVFVKETGRERRSQELTKTIETLKPCVRYVRFNRMSEFEKEVHQSIRNEINRLFFSSPKTFSTVRSIYEYAIEIISRTQNELYTVEKSSLLLLGPHKATEEQHRYYKFLNDWIREHVVSAKSTTRFYSLYSMEQTREKLSEIMKRGQNNLLEAVRKRLQYYLELQRSTNGRFKLYPVKGRVNPFIVGDDEFGVWFAIGNSQLGVSFVNKKVSAKWKDEIERLTQEQKNLNTILKELGLM